MFIQQSADSGNLHINKHARFGEIAISLTEKGKQYLVEGSNFLIVCAVNYKINKILSTVAIPNEEPTIKITYEIAAKTSPFGILRGIEDDVYTAYLILTLKDTT